MSDSANNSGCNCLNALEIWPAPMEGLFSPEFVRAVNALDLVPRWMTPFLRLSENLPRPARLREFIAPFLDSRHPVTVQLMGSDAELLGQAAERLIDLGAAGIDLNFGCPSNRVVSGGAGGGALRHPERLPEFCCRVKEHLPTHPLSVKLRAGFDTPETMERLLPALAVSGALSKIFFHCRTVRELYRPIPDRLERFRRAVALAAPLPVILNGDLDSVSGTRELVAETGGAGAMIGRAWLRDPGLLRRFDGQELPPEPTREQLFDEVCRHEIPPGAKLELIRMLWGANHPRFLAALPNRHVSDHRTAGG